MGAKDLSGLGGPLSIGSAETVSSADYDVLLLRCVSAPLAADHNFSGTLNLMMGVQESNAAADMAYYLHVFVTQGDTDNLRGTLLANYADPDTNEWGTTALGKALSAAATLTAVAALTGDRIVVEIGYRSRNTVTTSRTGTIWYGGSGSDLTSGGAADGGVGYFDFSDTFTLVDNPVLRVSQVAVEALRRPTEARLQVSQLAIETVRRATSGNLRLTQLAVEVVRRNGSPPSTGQGGMLIVVAG
ncbi:MAG: hypothetical protein EBQ89_01035 [Alphaproteobacteria bacterium]|nr:hypothetical protein [Alphaproteobacteria bacterium]